MELEIRVTRDNFLRNYLELLNGILRLTPRELDCLLLFLEFDDVEACSGEARKVVAAKMHFKGVSVLNNYVKGLKDKGVIYWDVDCYRYNRIIRPDERVDFKFIFHTDLPLPV